MLCSHILNWVSFRLDEDRLTLRDKGISWKTPLDFDYLNNKNSLVRTQDHNTSPLALIPPPRHPLLTFYKLLHSFKQRLFTVKSDSSTLCLHICIFLIFILTILEEAMNLKAKDPFWGTLDYNRIGCSVLSEWY